MTFKNRQDAGSKLAQALLPYAHEKPIILALPRGGIAIGFEVAQTLNAPLDVLVVRKLGAPHHEELAIGAIGPGNVAILNHDLIQLLGISNEALQTVIDQETLELNRRLRRYRGERPYPNFHNRTVIIVDDGLATGATALAAIQTIKEQHPARVILAVPVCARSSAFALRSEVDDLVCLETPDQFSAVSLWYVNFDQTTDEEVMNLLNKSWRKVASKTETGD